MCLMMQGIGSVTREEGHSLHNLNRELHVWNREETRELFKHTNFAPKISGHCTVHQCKKRSILPACQICRTCCPPFFKSSGPVDFKKLPEDVEDSRTFNY
jgi:hypothetical protein